MARVFISYSRGDLKIARELCARITEAGHNVFLDTDPKRGVEIGEEWERRIYQRLREADAVVALLTKAYATSPWCLAEVAVARSRGAELLPLQVEPEAHLPLLHAVNYVRYFADPESALDQVLAQLRRIDIGNHRGWPDDRNPYPGLAAFDTEMAPVFFGRVTEVDTLARTLETVADSDDRRALFVVGPPGCGKSSLVRAGLVPAMSTRREWWVLPPLVPGDDPIANLGAAFSAAARRLPGLSWTDLSIQERLAGARGLRELAADLLRATSQPTSHLLIVVDQFEELLGSTDGPRNADFVTLLADAVSSKVVQLVATIHADQVEQVQASPEFARLAHSEFRRLPPLTRSELRDVVEEPARLAGFHLDEALLKKIVTDTGDGDALPLLAYTLAELARGLRRGEKLSAARYGELGGVQGTLVKRADEALGEALRRTDATEQDVLGTLLRLVDPGDGSLPERGSLDRAEISADEWVRLEPFVSRHLLTVDIVGGRAQVRVAHEAFLSRWEPLADAIGKQAQALRLRSKVEKDAKGWDTAGRPTSKLWQRGELRSFLDLDTPAEGDRRRGGRPRRGGGSVAARQPEALTQVRNLTPLAAEFLRASLRRGRRLRALVIMVQAVLLVLALIGAGIAVTEGQAAEDERRVAVSRGLIQEAQALRHSQPRVSLLLSVEAYRIAPTVEARGNLLSAQENYFSAVLPRQSSPVHSVAFVPDGGTLVTAGHDGTVSLWDIPARRDPEKLEHPSAVLSSPVFAVAVSPDGQRLACAEQNGVVSLWDLPERTLIDTYRDADGDAAGGVAFDPGGAILAVAGQDGDIQLLDARTLEKGKTFPGGPAPVNGISFNKDGSLLATAEADSTVTLWNTATGARTVLSGHTAPVRDVAFSPASGLLASGSDDGTVILWDTDLDPSEARVATMIGHTGPVLSVAFRHDGSLLASSGRDASARTWDPVSHAPLATLSGPTDSVLSITFSPNGRTLAGAGADSMVGLWNVSGPPPADTGSVASAAAFSPRPDGTGGHILATAGSDHKINFWAIVPTFGTTPGYPADPLPPAHRGARSETTGMAFNHHGTRLVVSPSGSGAQVWDLDPRGQPLSGLTQLVLDGEQVGGVAFSADGSLIASAGVATAGQNGVVRLWDAADGQPAPEIIYNHRRAANAVAFSPDGTMLASASDDAAVAISDISDSEGATNTLPVILTGHLSTVEAVAFSPDGTVLASASTDGTVQLWDATRSFSHLATLFGNDRAVVSVAFSPTGDTLASADSDGTVRLWDMAGRSVWATLTSNASASSVTFSPDGTSLAIADPAGTPIVWDIDPDGVAKRICELQPSLTRSEWSRYVPGEPYRNVCR